MTASERDTPRARIAWVAQNAGAPTPEIIERFSTAGFRLSLGAGAAAVDLAIIDIAERDLSPKAVEALSAAVRRAAPEALIVFRASVELAVAERGHLRRTGELVFAEAGADWLVAACRNRIRLRNIAEETGERLKSVAATARLAEFPPIETSSAAPSVLVAGAPSPLALAALSAADRAAADIVAALSPQQMLRALDARNFDCVVVAPEGAHDPFVSLARALRARKRWQDTPFLMAAGGDYAHAASEAARFAADATREEHIMEDLGQRIVAVARRGRLAAAMRRFLGACAGDGVRDRLSGAFASPFFAAHGERLFARAEATGRPYALVAARLDLNTGSEGPASARALSDAARHIRRATRTEDFVSRLGHDTFVAILPATGVDDAELVARRVEGVVSHALFQEPNGRPFSVAVTAVASPRRRGDRIEEALAAVLSELRRKTPKRAER